MQARYHILREIGRGAMGRVYLAHDNLLERYVALKELSVPDYLSEEERAEVRERFRLEAKAAARLTHPHILTVHDIILQGDRQFMVMEYLEGKTMREVLAERRLSVSEVLSIAPMVCEALGYAHRQGIVHRDVKPDNIFVLQDGNIKLADFGIAKMIRVSERTHTDVIMGTPNYIAPEVIKGNPFDHRVDIFALGVTIYEMLSGRRPFDAENDFAIIYRVATEEPVPLSDLVEGLPPGLVHAVHRALHKDPTLRYQDVEELKSDLMEVRSELGMGTRAEEAFTKEEALRRELEAAREAEISEWAGDRGYDFRRDKEWKELIARIYSEQPKKERVSEAPPWAQRGVESGFHVAQEPRAPSASVTNRVAIGRAVSTTTRPSNHIHAGRAGNGKLSSLTGGRYSPGSRPGKRGGESLILSSRAKRLAVAIPALGTLLVASTLFPWIEKGLNPQRSMAGISFPEGMVLSSLVTLVAGCDALVLLRMVSSERWTQAMKGMSLLGFVTTMLFLGLRAFAGLGYPKAPDLSLGGVLGGIGWGLWLAIAGSLVFYILCSRLRGETC
ncbi:MAG: serine/threonine-protein kinase [Actinomycetota bacterium]